jgi:hypothetical protein
VQVAKNDPEAQKKSSLSDCTWLENEYGSFNLEALKFLVHFREQGSSLYFILFLHILIYFFSFFLIHILFLFLYTHFFLFLSHHHFLFAPPLNSKIALYLPPPPCFDVCSSSGKEVIKIR